MNIEHGRDWADQTADHVNEGTLDFDVWIYRRTLGGWTIAVRQLPPQEMLEAMGVSVAAAHWSTLICAGGMTTHQVGLVLDVEAVRAAWEDLPPDVQAEVFATASCGWIWDGVEHRFDPAEDAWVPA
jgi:hypothetical protein